VTAWKQVHKTVKENRDVVEHLGSKFGIVVKKKRFWMIPCCCMTMTLQKQNTLLDKP